MISFGGFGLLLDYWWTLIKLFAQITTESSVWD